MPHVISKSPVYFLNIFQVFRARSCSPFEEMAKRTFTDILSLDPRKQKKVSKEVTNLKKRLEEGEITIKDERKAILLTAEQKRGLIFISHLPHGFYEDELKNYFKQFGKVTNVKVCRSNKTGRSKGFGYVEFSHPEVAKIAGETMNNYLMFKKRLSVDYVPHEKRPKKLFHGKSSTELKYSTKIRRNKQFKANVTADDNKHSARTKMRSSRLRKKLKRLSDLGLDVASDTSVITKQSSNCDDSSDPEIELKVKRKKQTTRSLSQRTKKESAASKEFNKTSNTLLSDVNCLDQFFPSKSKPNVKSNLKRKSNIPKDNSKKIRNNLTSLNSETVKKIARELIRKRGTSLLTLPKVSKTTTRKK